MFRLFVGVELPAELRRRIVLIQTGIERAKWVPEENIHLTLRFIGEVPGDVAADVADALATVRAPRNAEAAIAPMPIMPQPRTTAVSSLVMRPLSAACSAVSDIAVVRFRFHPDDGVLHSAPCS